MSTTSTDSSSRPRHVSIAAQRAAAREELARLGIRPRKTWGQSFLLDAFVADAEAALVESPRDSRILEVGGGLGVLTEALLRRGFKAITVIERDRRLAGLLRGRFGSKIEVVEADATTWDWDRPSALVSNFPYAVATPLLLEAFDRGTPEVVGLLQQEVAERLAAGPGSRRYGRLSILTALYGSAELFQVVSGASFEPPPDVASRLFRFQRRRDPLPVPSVTELESLLATLFAGRRKQLKNLLPRVVRPPNRAGAVAEAAGWPGDWGTKRPEELTPEQYFALARALGVRGERA